MFESAKGNSEIDKYVPLKRQEIELTKSYLLVYYAKCFGNFLLLILNIVLVFVRLKQEKEDFLNPALKSPLDISIFMVIFIIFERILTLLYFIQQSKKLGKGVGAPILHTLSFTDFLFMKKHAEVSDLWCLQVQKAARETIALNIPFCYFGLIIFFDQFGIKKGKYDILVFLILCANFAASISGFYSMYIYRSMYCQFFCLKQNRKFNDLSVETRKFISNPYIISWFKVFSEEVKRFDEVYTNPERKNIDQLYTYNQKEVDFDFIQEFEEYDYDLLKKEVRVSILKKTWLVFYFGFFISSTCVAFVQSQYTTGSEMFNDIINLFLVTGIFMFPQIIIHLNYAVKAPQGCGKKLLGFFLNLLGIPFAILSGMAQFIFPIRNEPVPLFLAQSRANWVENFYPVSYQMLARFVILTMQRTAINNMSDPDKWVITEHNDKLDYLIYITQTKTFYRLSALVNTVFVCTIFLYLGYFFEYLEVHYLGGKVTHEPIQQVDEKALFFHSFFNEDINQNEDQKENEIVKLDDDGSYRDEDMDQSDPQIESPPYKPNDDLYGSAYSKKDDIKI